MIKNSLMKAAVLVSNKKIKIKKIKIPKIKDDECLVQIKFSGICSSDIYRAFFNRSYFYPLIMGHEISGVIKKIGKKVKGFGINQNVGIFPLLPCNNCIECKNKKYARCKSYNYYGSRNNGGFAEYLAVKKWNLIKCKDIDLYQLSTLEPFSVCVHAIKLLNLKKFDRKSICIIGAGYLGLIISEILSKIYSKNLLYQIDRNFFKLKLSKKNNKKNFLIKNQNEFVRFSNKNKFDIVIEATGNHQMMSNSIDLVSSGGRCVWLGNIDQDLVLKKRIVSSILRKEISILGSWNSDFKSSEHKDDWKKSIFLMKKFKLNTSKYVTKFIKLDNIFSLFKKLYLHKLGKKKFNYIKYSVKF
jgi:L-iditol 2-dehydrogenase